LNWRRFVIAENCEGKLYRFHQEFPSTPEEAFISSGHTYFDLGRVESCCQTEAEPLRGRLELLDFGGSQSVVFQPHNEGDVLVWKRPQRGRQYVIGCDSATGADPNAEGNESDPDYSSLVVMDLDTGEQVAAVRERYTEVNTATILELVGRWYNRAFICPEANFTGRGVIQELLHLEYPVDLLYQRERAADDRRPPTLNEIGFMTNVNSRPQLLSLLSRAFLDGSITVRDPVTAQEIRTFVVHPDGKAEALRQRGCHDDTVIALALAVKAMQVAPRRPLAAIVQEAQTKAADYRPTRYSRRDMLEDD
jgi:hypothetical protein